MYRLPRLLTNPPTYTTKSPTEKKARRKWRRSLASEVAGKNDNDNPYLERFRTGEI
jgi:hypothetical protein